jgi:hypothetical protein
VKYRKFTDSSKALDKSLNALHNEERRRSMGKIMELYEQMKNDLVTSNFRHKKGIIMCLGHYDVQFEDLEKKLTAAKPSSDVVSKKQYEKLEKKYNDALEAMADHSE